MESAFKSTIFLFILGISLTYIGTVDSQQVINLVPKRSLSFYNDSIPVVVTLTWDGATCPDLYDPSNGTNNTCDGLLPMPTYACSMGDPGSGNWNDGEQTFLDPIPPGNTLKHVDITIVGRFFCDQNQPKATFVAQLNDLLLLWNRLPDDVQDCNCEPCGANATFAATGEDYESYQYGKQNQFQIYPVTNDICIYMINLTLWYKPFDAQVTAVVPNSGPSYGGTVVNVTGPYFRNTTWYCKFGDQPVVGHALDESTILCVTPAVAYPGPVLVTVSENNVEYSQSNVTFTYITNSPPTPNNSDTTWQDIVNHYWWLLLGGSLLLLLGISFFILNFKSKRKRRADYTTPLLGSTASMIKFREDVDFSEVKLAERIGKGSFGEVYKGLWRGIVVAVKKTKISVDSEDNETFLEDFEREAQIMRSLRHPNVLQFLGICDAGGGEICILMEFMPRGSLYRILHDKSIIIDWELRLKIATDVALGMNYLHKCDPIIIHRDLKSHNLLVDENFKVKVSDFGLAKLFSTSGSMTAMTSCGTPAWTAPEVLRNEKYDETCDVYSFGVVLWELVSREDPHHGLPPFQIVFAVGTQGVRPIIPPSCSSEFSSFIEDCWAENPRDRPNFDKILTRLEILKKSKVFV